MRLFSMVLLVGCACPVLGDTVLYYDNGGPANSNAFVSDPSFPIQYGDNFPADEPVSVTCVEWWGAYKNGDPLPAGADEFSLQFYEMVDGEPLVTPIAVVDAGSVARDATGGRLPFGNDVFRYQAEFSPVALPAGEYLLSIVNDTLAFPSDWLWAWHDSSTDGGVWFRHEPADSWRGGSGGVELAFRIFIPEPGTLGMLLVSAAVFCRRR